MIDIDFDGRYAVEGYRGVAFYLTGWQQRWEPLTTLIPLDDGEECEIELDEGEWVDDPESGIVRAVMVGDDREHLVDVDDLTKLDEGDYCHGCGVALPIYFLS
jgi:hypothetical protein